AAALADDALVADALVLAAVALPVLRRTEDALAEQPVALRLEGPVVDRLGLRDLAGGPVTNLLAGRKPDPNRVELVDVDQFSSSVPSSPRSQRRPGLPRPSARPRPEPLQPATRRTPARRPTGRRAPRPWEARARRPRRPAPGPPRPLRPSAA